MTKGLKIMFGDKKELTAQGTKTEFIKSIYSWIMETLDKKGKSQYKDCFKIEGSSIMCYLPDDYFNFFTIPENTRIEMKFIAKK